MERSNNRRNDELRPVKLTRNFTKNAAGSVLIEVGNTRVICTASVDARVPHFLRGKKQGWLTGEYSLLPGSTTIRSPREAARGRQGGRTLEIQRLIGRSLRACLDMQMLGERTIHLDCDVIEADGGTRCASITGAYVALVDAIRQLMDSGELSENPIICQVASVSVGIVEGNILLDVEYVEDFNADVDVNIVMNERGEFIEVQGTAEKHAFTADQFSEITELASLGISQLIEIQNQALQQKLAD